MEMSRRKFVHCAAATGAALATGGQRALAQTANDRLNIAVVGVANRGADNLAGVSSENIVALCDIDDNYLNAAAQRFPAAKTFSDYRRMLEAQGIDAVVVSTPDHMHAPVTLAALESGRNVYCEKPLAHTVAEARQVAVTARRLHRVTQMGTQIHASGNYRRVVEMIRTGAIGDVREVHVFVGRVWAGDGRPAATPPVPANLHWDLWLGVAPARPYNPAYLPQNWRGWWDFGGGTLSDMACHHMDLPFWALSLGYPETVQADGPPVSAENTPAWLIVTYTFPARGKLPPVTLTWYHGEKRPPQFAEGKLPAWGDGTLFVGEKGMLLADYDRRVLLPEKDFEGYVPPAPWIPDSIGHHREWIEACKHGGEALCNFDYAGQLSESALLGNVAYRAGRKLQWDAVALRAIGCPEADSLVHPRYRTGW